VIKQKNSRVQDSRWFYGQMNEPPGARLRVALSALAMTEYFRDEKNQTSLLFIDNIFRFRTGSEVSACWAARQRRWLPAHAGRRDGPICRTNYFDQKRLDHSSGVYVPADD